MPKNQMSNNKTPNVTNRPKTNHPNNKTPKITKSSNLKKAQIYKMSKITKCPKLQIMSLKLQNVQGYKTKVTTFWFFCTIFMFI